MVEAGGGIETDHKNLQLKEWIDSWSPSLCSIESINRAALVTTILRKAGCNHARERERRCPNPRTLVPLHTAVLSEKSVAEVLVVIALVCLPGGECGRRLLLFHDSS